MSRKKTSMDEAKQVAACEDYGGIHVWGSNADKSELICKNGAIFPFESWKRLNGEDVLRALKEIESGKAE